MEDKPINSGQRSFKFPIFTVLLIAFLALVLILSFTGGPDTKKEISINELYTSIDEGKVASLHFYGSTVKGIYKGDTELETEEKIKSFPKNYDFYLTIAYSTSASDIKAYLADKDPNHEIKIIEEPVKESFFSQMIPYLYVLLLLVMGYFIYKTITKMTGKNNDFGRNKARMESGLKVRFSDVAGCEEEKREMEEIVEFLKNPRKFTDLGARIPKGVLLVGPPGTGKTLLAKAIAGEAGVPFFSITGSDFVEMFVGVGAARVRDLFETAKRNMPCLIFIDEIDAVGRQRGAGLGNTNDEREQTLNQLLVQMDGFESSDGVVVIAATNRPDVLDPALLRAGRFDRQIVVNRPDLEGRKKILKLYAKDKPFADNINWDQVARRLPGATGADIENILNEAAILAVRENRNLITQSDIFEGSLKVVYGPKKSNKKLDEEDKKSTAVHEAGHAIVCKLSKYLKHEVQEVSIIPRGIAGGLTASAPIKDLTQETREQMEEEIAGLMGGRAAEKLKYGYVATGASNDIQKATDIARSMVTQLGMSEVLGPVCYAGDQEVFIGRDYQHQTNYSETTATLIDQEIKKIIEDNENHALKLIKENEKVLDEMVTVLLEKQTIYSEEVDELLSGLSAKEVIVNMNKREKQRMEADKKEFERKEAERKAEQEKLQRDFSELDAKIQDALNKSKANSSQNTKEKTTAKKVIKHEENKDEKEIIKIEAKAEVSNVETKEVPKSKDANEIKTDKNPDKKKDEK